jgi:hypothetical protein
LQIDDGTWANWAKNPRCELDFPPQFSKNAFHKLMVLQALRPDRLQSAIKVLQAL